MAFYCTQLSEPEAAMYSNQRTSMFARVSLGVVVTFVAIACRDIVSPTPRASVRPGYDLSGTSGEIRGTGSIGTGDATPGSSRQDFDFDITSGLAGHLTFTDWSVVRSASSVGQLTVSTSDAGTWFAAYRDGSTACADPTHGVEVDGTGRLDTGVLISFTLYVCDNGPAGSGTDFLRFYMSGANYDRNGSLSSGDVSKAGTVPPTQPNTR